VKKILLYVLIAVIIFFSFLTFKNYLQISIYPIIKTLEYKRILRSKKDYKYFHTENFCILYIDDIDFARITGEVMEEHYEKLCKKLDCFPNKKVPVIIYYNQKELLETIRLKKDNSPVGAYYSGIIHLLSPTEWIEDKDNINEIYRATTPVVHEFTHLLVDEKTKNNYPLWFTEGIALYMEDKLMGFEWEEGKGETSSISLEDLNKNFSNLEQGLAYRKSYEIVSYLAEDYGFDKINLLLDSLGKGQEINNSFEAVLKIKIEEFD